MDIADGDIPPRDWVARRSEVKRCSGSVDLPHQATIHSDPSQTQSRAPYTVPGKKANDFGSLGPVRRRPGVAVQFRAPVGAYSTETGILPMRDCHSRGPVRWTDSPWASTATVTGMSWTVNS